MSPRTVDDLLDEARSRIRRLDPHAAWRGLAERRPAGRHPPDPAAGDRGRASRARWWSSATCFEWRFDPASDHRLAEVADHDQDVVVVCSEGYASSLVAAVLVDLGFETAADLEGGFVAWAEAGLPVEGGLAATAGRSGTDVVA